MPPTNDHNQKRARFRRWK